MAVMRTSSGVALSDDDVAAAADNHEHQQQVVRSLVAQTVNRKDWMQHNEAKAAVQKEWDRLLQKRTWAMPERPQDVTFMDQVIRESKASGKQIHLGRLFDICVLKGSELPEGHINRKWKGRVVFGGNQVQDEYGTARPFQRPAQAPAMPAPRSYSMRSPWSPVT